MQSQRSLGAGNVWQRNAAFQIIRQQVGPAVDFDQIRAIDDGRRIIAIPNGHVITDRVFGGFIKVAVAWDFGHVQRLQQSFACQRQRVVRRHHCHIDDRVCSIGLNLGHTFDAATGFDNNIAAADFFKRRKNCRCHGVSAKGIDRNGQCFFGGACEASDKAECGAQGEYLFHLNLLVGGWQRGAERG